MSDIVERIREVFDDTPEIVDMCDESYEGQEIASHIQGLYEAALEAADQIERLRAALVKIMQKCPYARKDQWCACIDCNCIIARAALAGEASDDAAP